MSSINFNDYMNYANYDTGYDFSALMGGTTNSSGNLLSDYETNLKIIQEIMGHADITTTMDIYNESTKEKKLESFARLEGKIKIK